MAQYPAQEPLVKQTVLLLVSKLDFDLTSSSGLPSRLCGHLLLRGLASDSVLVVQTVDGDTAVYKYTIKTTLAYGSNTTSERSITVVLTPYTGAFHISKDPRFIIDTTTTNEVANAT